MLNRAYFRQFFELEGPPFGSGQPLYTTVGLCNYVANGDVENFFDFLICKQTVDTYRASTLFLCFRPFMNRLHHLIYWTHRHSIAVVVFNSDGLS